MSRGWLLVLIPVIVLGCTPKDRDDALATGSRVGRVAADKVVDAAGRAWKAAAEQASKLNPDSASAALENAKGALERTVSDLKPGERLDAAKAEIERLRAALDLQKLKKGAEEKLAEAQQLKENAGKAVDDMKAKIDAADQAYQDLKSKIDDAQKTYDMAAKKADDAKQAVSSMVSGA